MQIWILTFKRPIALNRLISHFGSDGYKVNILSNDPGFNRITDIAQANYKYINKIVINNLNSGESNSWCARAWNTCIMKAFDEDDEAIFIQDDTDIGPGFKDWFEDAKLKCDFIWGPAGDQFFYMKKSVWQTVGWWDERYIGCYCGDADYLKRVFMEWDRSRISIHDTHNWGTIWNDCGLARHIITTFNSKTADPSYDNQHWEFERRCKDNPTLKHSQDHFRAKWGVDLDNNQPVINSLVRKFREIDWYPWFSVKHGMKRPVTDIRG